MTWEWWTGVGAMMFHLCSRQRVQDKLYHGADRFLRGVRSRGVASVGAGTVLRQASHPWARRRPTLGSVQLVRLKRTVRDEQFGSRLSPQTSSRAATRATLDHPAGSQRKLRARRCCSLTAHRSQTRTAARRSPVPPPCARHGRPCAGHPDPEERRTSDNRDHRDKPGDDRERGSGRAHPDTKRRGALQKRDHRDKPGDDGERIGAGPSRSGRAPRLDQPGRVGDAR